MTPAARRRAELVRTLPSLGLDALLITDPINVTYLTGFTGEASPLVLARSRTVLVSDGRFEEQLTEECPDLDVHIRRPDVSVLQASADTLARLEVQSVGFESGHLTVAGLEQLKGYEPAVEWSPRADLVEKMRAVKDADEVAAIREAIAVAETAFARFRAQLTPDATEKQLADDLELLVRRAGGRCTAFPPIVAAGPRSALPHAPPTGRRIGEAGFLLVDWGAVTPLYHSDLTRVLAVPTAEGRPRVASELRTLYTVVMSARAAALAAVRPGVRAHDVDQAARAAVEAAGYGPKFNHGLGHGLGLKIHEAPFLRPRSEEELRTGMVITIEPGVYQAGFGGVRIEDDVLITADGCEVLTGVPRDPDEL